MTITKNTEATTLGGDLGNSAEDLLEQAEPYYVEVEITGTAALLFHRWQSDSVDAKASASKGSTIKTTDDVESYIWRNDAGEVCLPGAYLRSTVTNKKDGAAKYERDPRSATKSALDLYTAILHSVTDLAPITTVTGNTASTWDYLDRRRAVVAGRGITRERPALLAGWKATVILRCLKRDMLSSQKLLEVLVNAGRFCGVGDYRPTYGRFNVTRYELLT